MVLESIAALEVCSYSLRRVWKSKYDCLLWFVLRDAIALCCHEQVHFCEHQNCFILIIRGAIKGLNKVLM